MYTLQRHATFNNELSSSLKMPISFSHYKKSFRRLTLSYKSFLHLFLVLFVLISETCVWYTMFCLFTLLAMGSRRSTLKIFRYKNYKINYASIKANKANGISTRCETDLYKAAYLRNRLFRNGTRVTACP